MSPIRVLIVDDSSFMRTAISSMLRGNDDIQIVGTATNGREGLEQARLLKPDLITMDIEMPVMTGLEALRELMTTDPTTVIMISTLTTEGAQATVEALSLGAADFIPKQTTFAQHSINQFKTDLLGKIRALADSRAMRMRFRPRPRPDTPPPAPKDTPAPPTGQRLSLQERIQRRLSDPEMRRKFGVTGDLQRTDGREAQRETQREAQQERPLHRVQVTGKSRPPASHFRIAVLGVSTGGPLALQQVIPRLPAGLPVPLLVVQHMPAHFTRSLAERLNSLSHVTVVEAKDHDTLTPGMVYIAPGGQHMTLNRDRRTIRIAAEPSTTLHRPSVDITVESVAEHFGGNALGIIMTGMGRDGAAGLLRLHRQGGYVIAQDEETSIVYGMPKAVVDEGAADEIHALEDLAEAITSCLGVRVVPQKTP